MDLPDLAHPERLLWLLALPVLYLLSLPPRPKVRVLTAHMRQWRRALAKLRRRPLRFRRLRFWLLILAATATILAASGPSLEGREGAKRLIILLDDSASMAAAEGDTESAWQRARALLASTLATLPGGVTLQLALSGDAQIRRGSAAEILAALPDQPTGTGKVAFADLAAGLASIDQAIWTITDGRDHRRIPSVGALSLVGRDLSNLGLIACELDDRWPLPVARISLRAADFGLGRDTVTIGISGAGGPATVSIPLISGLGQASFELARGSGGSVLLSIVGSADALPADDTLQLWLPPPPAPDIALMSATESSLWLRKAGEVLANESGGQLLAEPGAEAGFLLVEGGHLPEPWGRGISFGTAFGDTMGQDPDPRIAPRVLDWDRHDPITRGLDFSDLLIERAIDASLLPAGEPLIWGPEGALMVLAGRGASRSLHLAFQLVDSNLPLLPAFPQLLRRGFARCYGERAQARIEPGNLCSATESDLRLASPRPADRPLPVMATPGTSLSVPLLLLALLAMACRVYA